MDEYSKYLTWVKSKKMQGNNSWESQAFDQDHGSSPFGGLVWPPRSYSCGFCNRQFRSAQALGGHMNVHRRDRARLKQDQHQEPASAAAAATTTPIHDHDHHHHHHHHNNNNNNNIINCNSSSYVNVVVNPTSNSTISPHSSSSNSSNSSSRSENQENEKGTSYMRRIKKRKREKDVNLCIGLSLGGGGCKRMKVSTTAHVIPTLPFFLHPSSRSSSGTHDEATIRINGSSMKDLDLELRLGSLY